MALTAKPNLPVSVLKATISMELHDQVTRLPVLQEVEGFNPERILLHSYFVFSLHDADSEPAQLNKSCQAVQLNACIFFMPIIMLTFTKDLLESCWLTVTLSSVDCHSAVSVVVSKSL